MKKLIHIFIILLSLVILTSCNSFKSTSDAKTNTDLSNGSNSPVNKNSINYTIRDYYPFKENVKYVYEGKGNEYSSYSTWVDYVSDNRIQLRVNNGGTEVVKVLENSGGELKLIFSKEECYYRENLTSKPGNKNEVLIKEPITKGTTWSLSDGRTRYISNIDVQVNTPSGSFKALEITTEGKDYKTMDYYAPNVGLIKTVYSSNGIEVTSTLSKVETNSPFTQDVKFYYINGNEDKIYAISKNLSFNTNDITRTVFEKHFKESSSKELGRLISPNTKINSLYLNKDNVVYVDFSKELVSEMNAGAGFEEKILQCITNTLGNYYGVDKVYITVENKPYSSGHYVMKQGETFKVDTKN